ncbi:MAG: hypothetical protein ACLU0O_12495 [Collinsella sp.]
MRACAAPPPSRRRPTVFCRCAAAAFEDLATFNDEELLARWRLVLCL